MSVWNKDTTFLWPIFNASMLHDVFKNILRFISTVDHEIRSKRKFADKLVTMKEVWDIFCTIVKIA